MDLLRSPQTEGLVPARPNQPAPLYLSNPNVVPGQIVQGMKKGATINPVFMLDEIDKIGHDFRGDPAAGRNGAVRRNPSAPRTPGNPRAR